MSPKHLNRRKFLQSLGHVGASALAIDPFTRALNAMLEGMISKAYAAETGIQPRNFVHLYLNGGPARWAFDLPLDPRNAGNIYPEKAYTTTNASGNPIYQTAMVTAGGKTYQMPQMWSKQVPRPNGSWANMSDLLSNMLIVRGINMGGGEHSISHRLLRTVTDVPSLDGVVADYSNAVMPAYMLGDAPGTYKSVSGKALLRPSGSGNRLQQVMSPYINSNDGIAGAFNQRILSLDSDVQATLASLRNYASSSRPGAEALYSDRKNAEDLIRAGVGDLVSTWNTLFGKYNALLTQAVANISKVLPNPVNNDGLGRFGKFLPHANDLRNTLAPVAIFELAEHLAITEFLLTRGLTSTIKIKINTTKLDLQGYTEYSGEDLGTSNPKNVTTTKRFEYPGDDHYGRPNIALVATSAMYYQIATGLYELAQSLKAANIYQNTVIQIASEFSRQPRRDDMGSDHASDAGQLTLISGAIKQPLILGNIKRGKLMKDDFYGGTLGKAATVEHEGSSKTVLKWEHALSTTAELLRVPSPVSNFHPVAKEQNGNIVALISEPENKNE